MPSGLRLLPPLEPFPPSVPLSFFPFLQTFLTEESFCVTSPRRSHAGVSLNYGVFLAFSPSLLADLPRSCSPFLHRRSSSSIFVSACLSRTPRSFLFSKQATASFGGRIPPLSFDVEPFFKLSVSPPCSCLCNLFRDYVPF